MSHGVPPPPPPDVGGGRGGRGRAPPPRAPAPTPHAPQKGQKKVKIYFFHAAVRFLGARGAPLGRPGERKGERKAPPRGGGVKPAPVRSRPLIRSPLLRTLHGCASVEC